MKKIIPFLTCIILSYNINAKKVDTKTAKNVASQFLTEIIKDEKLSIKSFSIEESSLKLVKSYYQKSVGLKSTAIQNPTPAIYVYEFENKKGFIMISGETSLPPVLGYSSESHFDEKNLPPQLKNMIDLWISGSENVEELSNKYIKQNSDSWNKYLIREGSYLKSTEYEDIEPLITSKWGQGQYFNEMCPKISGQKTYVGCVATAVVQIMKYWNYPSVGTGNINYDYDYGNVSVNFNGVEYDWQNMPDVVSSTNNSVAKLCYHVGAAIRTNYGTTESSANNHSIAKALKDFFNYKQARTLHVNEELSIDDLKNEIVEELNSGRPVILSGSNSNYKGHSYICDGFKNNLFHLNFGWNGNSDGYYDLSTELEYNNWLTLLANIEPSKIFIDNNTPLVGETVKVKFLDFQPNHFWKISPMEDVTVEQNENGGTLNVFFNKLGTYTFSIYEISGEDTIVVDETQFNVSFVPYKHFQTAGLLACGQSSPVQWFDYDNDGDLDLYCSWKASLLKNSNGEFEHSMPMNKAYNGSFEVFDYNNDSFLDIVKTESRFDNGKYVTDIFLYKNINGERFEKQDILLPSLGGGSIIPRDFNNDGFIDLLCFGVDYYSVGDNEYLSSPLLKVLYNNGNSFDEILEATILEHNRSEKMVACDDFDNDGDIDIIVRNKANSSNSSTCKIFKNEEDYFIESTISQNGNTLISGDFDNDGKIDLISPSYAFPCPDCLNYGINIGYNINMNFENEKYYSDKIFEYNRIGATDFNCDGKIDFFVTNTEPIPSNMVGFNIFLNNIGANNSGSKSDFNLLSDNYASFIGADAHCGDYNNDGYPDVAIGASILNNANGSNIYSINTKPTQPTNLSSIINENGVELSWERSSDEQTPDLGLSYNLMIGTTYGGCEVMSPMSNLATGKRKIVAMGNVYQNTSYELTNLKHGKYYWSVQAIDNGYLGSNFAPIDSFVVKTINNVEICEGESFNGWEEEGQYTQILENHFGEDSIVTTNLTISNLPTAPDLIHDNDTISVVDLYTTYQWYDEDGLIEGATSKEYVIQKSGTYYLEVTNEAGCSTMSGGVNMVLTGLNDLHSNQFDFTVVPNPNSGIFKLRFSNVNHERYQVKVLNQNGQILYIDGISHKNKNSDHSFDLSFLPAGIYFLNLSNSYMSKTKKILIE